MKISMNNYEAYLIDYMDGRLNDAEIQQLKAFCIQNHINFEELTEDLPVLESPNDSYDEKEYLFKNKIIPFGSINEDNYKERFIAYQELLLDGEEEREVDKFTDRNPFLFKDLLTYGKCRLEPDVTIVFKDKDSLKKKAIIMPLYARIAAVAAVIALLFGLFWLPKDENNDINQQPILVELTPETNESISKDTLVSPENHSDKEINEESGNVVRNISENEQIASNGNVFRNVDANTQKPSIGDVARNVSTEYETEEIQEIRPEQIGIEPELLASLSPQTTAKIEVSKDFAIENDLFPETVFFLPIDDYYLAQYQDNDYEYYDHHLSLIGRGISWLSDGRYKSFGEIISDGLHIAKREVIELSEQAVAIAYIKADENFNEVKTKLEERFDRKDE